MADAIDRKDIRSVRELLEPYALATDLRNALLEVADLYGEVDVLDRARQLAPWAETQAELDDLTAVLAEFEDDSELLLDLGRARRLSYYTGVTFQAYTFDFGQPLLGGGRYDGALLPYAAGFTLGTRAPPVSPTGNTPLYPTPRPEFERPARQTVAGSGVRRRACP